MSKLVLHPTSTAQWHSLVHEAQHGCAVTLGEELESYLVFLLMRFTRRPEMARSVMALQYLEGMGQGGSLAVERIRDVGDQCLLTCGLFPSRARRRRVRISYFVEMGQGAFLELGRRASRKFGQHYTRLAHGFVPMMDVLQNMRPSDDRPDVLAAMELLSDTGSAAAGDQLDALVANEKFLIDAPGSD